ncbi:arsenate reductase/protein-tyrosine-phosphatase family protein [Actinomyces minihominis]|uniref:arsenate reductase/protein-tyrosine-phosphatase family protein n=1 Tax=Actinomyces minihominis TaxID=2002838 RepID=UPI0013EA59B4|nr:low molecular weight phosphatase family protein [Actinomyces minihominis]
MFRITTVCTGNICRSPLAELLLRADLPATHFSISSAGVMAVPNGQVPDQQLKIGKDLGLTDLARHRARMVTPGLIGASDLILAMSRRHRRKLVQMDPQAVRRIFTLREFAHLAEYVTPEDVEALLDTDVLSAAVEAVARMRGMVPPLESPDELDIVDPFKQSKDIYRASRDQLLPAAETTAAYFTGILDIFRESHPLTEPNIVSQGIPKISHLPKRSELRKRMKFGRSR